MYFIKYELDDSSEELKRVTVSMLKEIKEKF